jgi:fumarate reductase flavoprotein subunit
LKEAVTMNPGQVSQEKNMKADIVVIGGGGAGLAAAASAAEKGAKVILVEKRVPGGNSALAQGLFATESLLQKSMGIHTSRDEVFRTAMEYAHWRINPRIVRAFIDKSADTIQWLGKRGLRFTQMREHYAGQIRGFHALDASRHGGADIVKALRRNCEELGVQLLLHCPAKKILTGKNGGVTGIVAAMKGKEISIKAKSVIITTGGYGGNKKLLRKYCPTYGEGMQYGGAPNMGDGLLMAMEIGAATEGLGTILVHHHIYPESRNVNAIVRDPASIWVNKRGERFADETVGSRSTECGNVLDRQPEKCVIVLLDEKMEKRILEEMSYRLSLQRVGAYANMDLTNLEKELKLEAAKGGLKISGSWDEIATWTGIPPAVLKATVEEYNTFCDRGHDDIFAKDRRYLQPLRNPPYYAVRCYMHFLTTVGGIKINHRMEVLDKQDNPIPGLYAGGDCAGGWEGETYCMVIAGSAYSFAINSGRIAGENALEYIKSFGK